MGKFSYVIKNTLLNMRRTPLLVFATIIAVLVSSFLVFTTLSARSIVQNNTLRWQNGVHVVVFLDDRVTTTAHRQLEESLESYPEVRTVEYFSKSDAEEEFKTLFRDQPELLAEVDYEILPSSLRINLNKGPLRANVNIIKRRKISTILISLLHLKCANKHSNNHM